METVLFSNVKAGEAFAFFRGDIDFANGQIIINKQV